MLIRFRHTALHLVFDSVGDGDLRLEPFVDPRVLRLIKTCIFIKKAAEAAPIIMSKLRVYRLYDEVCDMPLANRDQRTFYRAIFDDCLPVSSRLRANEPRKVW